MCYEMVIIPWRYCCKHGIRRPFFITMFTLLGILFGMMTVAIMHSYRNVDRSSDDDIKGDYHQHQHQCMDNNDLNIIVGDILTHNIIKIYNRSATGMSIAHYGSGNGSWSVSMSALMADSSIVSFSMSSASHLSIHERLVVTAGVRNNPIVAPMTHSKRYSLPHDARRLNDAGHVILELVRTPEFFEIQVWHHRLAWEYDNVGKGGDLDKTLGHIMTLSAVSYLVLPSMLAQHTYLYYCAHTVKAVVKLKNVCEGAISCGAEDVIVVRVKLISMTRRVRRLVKLRCEYELEWDGDRLYQRKISKACVGSRERAVRGNSGTSIMALRHFRLAMVTRILLLALLTAHTDLPFEEQQSSIDNLMCCRGGVITPIDGALPLHKPACSIEPWGLRRYSDLPCILHRSYGLTIDSRALWVSNGCSGLFAVGGNEIECHSKETEYSECPLHKAASMNSQRHAFAASHSWNGLFTFPHNPISLKKGVHELPWDGVFSNGSNRYLVLLQYLFSCYPHGNRGWLHDISIERKENQLSQTSLAQQSSFFFCNEAAKVPRLRFERSQACFYNSIVKLVSPSPPRR